MVDTKAHGDGTGSTDPAHLGPSAEAPADTAGMLRFRAYVAGEVALERWYSATDPAALAEAIADYSRPAAEAVDRERLPWAIEFHDPAAPSGTAAEMRFGTAAGEMPPNGGATFAESLAQLAAPTAEGEPAQ